MMNKKCTACGKEKPATVENFYRHKQCLGGLDSACRLCRNAQRNDWRKKHADRLSVARRLQYAEKYGERNRQMEKLRFQMFPIRVQAERLMSGIRERSKELGFERPKELCDRNFFVKWLERQNCCECCGVDFLIGPKNGVWNDNSPSVDRFDTSRGYELDNISLLCWRCNNIKRNYKSQDLKMVALWMDCWGNEATKFDE